MKTLDNQFGFIFHNLDQLALATGGLQTITGMMHRREISDDLRHLDSSDWEGLSLATRALAEVADIARGNLLELAIELQANAAGETGE